MPRAASKQRPFMPRRAGRGGSCSSLDRRRSWCVSSHALERRPVLQVAHMLGHTLAYCAAMSADHGSKRRKPPPLPIHVSRPIITSPVLIHAGKFSENVLDPDEGSRFGDFTNIPLREHRI